MPTRAARLLENSPIALWGSAADSSAVLTSARWLELTGQAPEDTCGEAWLEAIHPDDRGNTERDFATCLAARRDFRAEYRLRHRDGTYRWMLATGRPWLSETGEFHGYVGSVVDIDEQKCRELELVRREHLLAGRVAELEAIYNGAPLGFCMLDLQLRYLRINQALAEINGHPVEAHLGRTVAEMVPAVAAAAERVRAIVLATRQVHRAEFVAESPAQPGVERVCDSSWYPLFGPDGEVFALSVIVEEITLRRAQERQLAEQAGLLKLSKDAIIVTDVADVITFWSASAAHLYGYSAEEAMGRNMVELLQSKFPDGNPRDSAEFRQTGAWSGEVQKTAKDGRACTVLVRLSSDGATGPSTHILRSHTDITERKAMEVRLSEAMNRLNAHLDCSPLAVIEWNESVQVTHWSTGAVRLFGYPPSLTIGRPLAALNLVHPEDAAKVAEVSRRLLAGRESFVLCENRNLTASGEVKYCRWFNTVVVAPGGSMSILSQVLDLTEQRDAEEQLRLSEARFRGLADSVPELVWSADAEGTVDYVNRRSIRYPGLKMAADGSWDWSAILHPDDAQHTSEAWRFAVATGSEYAVTHRLRTADGSYRWHLTHASVLPGSDGGPVRWFGAATDVDVQKRQEETLEQTVRARTTNLQEIVAELESFTYSISHDMRAPLRAMHNFAHFLETEYGPRLDDTARDYIRRIIAASRRLDRLTADVLTYSRTAPASLPLGPVDLHPLVQDLLSTLEESEHQAVRIEGRLPIVQGNHSALVQCCSNLIENALKFGVPGRLPAVVISAEPHGVAVRLRVSDNGAGIPSSAKERIFEIFQKLDPTTPGSGIGLAIVKKSVMRMGGMIGVDSTVGCGSTFWLELPGA